MEVYTTVVSLNNIIIYDYVYIVILLIVTRLLVTYWKSVVFMVSLNGLPGSKVPNNRGVVLAKHVNKCLWVHIEVIIKVTVPSEEKEGGRKEESEKERESSNHDKVQIMTRNPCKQVHK